MQNTQIREPNPLKAVKVDPREVRDIKKFFNAKRGRPTAFYRITGVSRAALFNVIYKKRATPRVIETVRSFILEMENESVKQKEEA